MKHYNGRVMSTGTAVLQGTMLTTALLWGSPSRVSKGAMT